MKDWIWIAVGGAVIYVLYEGGYLSALGLSPTTTTATGTTNTTNTTQSTATQTGGSTTSGTSTASTAPYPGGKTGPAPTTIAALQSYVGMWAAVDSNFVLMASGQFAGQYMAPPFHWVYYIQLGMPNVNVNLNSAFPGVDITQPMASSIFWNGAAAGVINANALPGMTQLLTSYGLTGLGIIAHNVNPYLLGPGHVQDKVYGAGLQPTGMERYIKVLGQ